MLDDIIDHGAPDTLISFNAGGDGKRIGNLKIRNNDCACSGRCLMWRGTAGPQGF